MKIILLTVPPYNAANASMQAVMDGYNAWIKTLGYPVSTTCLRTRPTAATTSRHRGALVMVSILGRATRTVQPSWGNASQTLCN